MLASSSLEKLNSVEETYYGVAKWVENLWLQNHCLHTFLSVT